MADLTSYRNQIDEIDKQLAKLFQQRMEVVSQVAAYKKLNGINTNDPNREKKMLEALVPTVDPVWQEYYRKFELELFTLSKMHQSIVQGETDPFLKDGAQFSVFADNAFYASGNAKKDSSENVINATVGNYCGEDGTLAAFDTVYNTYKEIPAKRLASYSGGIQGNADFNDEVFKWVNRLDNIKLPHKSVAAPGGTGTIVLPIVNCLNKSETLLIPNIAWGSYRVMAGQYGILVDEYSLFDDGKLTIEGIKSKCQEVMDAQGKVVIVINDPCQNPTGTSLGKENWRKLIEFFNELSTQGKVVIVNDTAYMDFSYNWQTVTDYMECFNDISENIAVIVAFSCSKSFTAYGMRLGDTIILAKNEETCEHLYNCFLRTARAMWSSVNNGMMDCFVKVMQEHKEEYLEEKAKAVQTLKARSDLFIKQANECGLPIYPYKEGFFVTVRVEDDDKLIKYEQALNAEHIYGVRFAHGLRVALCSLSVEKCDGLAYRLKEILDRI